jgi:hypothetical protein
MFALWTSGSVELQFQRMIGRQPFDSEPMRRELADRLLAIPSMRALPDKVLTGRPNFPIELLSDDTALETFLSTFDWYIEQVMSA